jgi:hypothetical protein
VNQIYAKTGPAVFTENETWVNIRGHLRDVVILITQEDIGYLQTQSDMSWQSVSLRNGQFPVIKTLVFLIIIHFPRSCILVNIF